MLSVFVVFVGAVFLVLVLSYVVVDGFGVFGDA